MLICKACACSYHESYFVVMDSGLLLFIRAFICSYNVNNTVGHAQNNAINNTAGFLSGGAGGYSTLTVRSIDRKVQINFPKIRNSHTKLLRIQGPTS